MIWEKLPEAKRGDFERKYEYELRQYRQAAVVLRRCQVDGEKIENGGKVTAEIVKHGKNKKIIVFKYKPKKNERRKQGHRQPFTVIKILSV